MHPSTIQTKMRNSMSALGFIFIVRSLFIATLLPSCHSSDSNNLIEQTCKQTPNYNLCVTSLKSDPRSSKATDVGGLALVMVYIVKAKASTTLAHINQELKKSPELKGALSACAEKYNAVLNADIPEAIQAVQLGDPKFGETGMNDAANEASFCEAEFKGKSSPLTNLNKAVHDTSLVAAAIIRQLL